MSETSSPHIIPSLSGFNKGVRTFPVLKALSHASISRNRCTISLHSLDFFCSVQAMPILWRQWSTLWTWITWTLSYKTIFCTYLYRFLALENFNRLCTFYIKVYHCYTLEINCCVTINVSKYSSSLAHRNSCSANDRGVTEGSWGNLSHVSRSAGVKPTCVMNVAQHFTAK